MTSTLVYGPAYLDRVLRVDRPLLQGAPGATVDGSVKCLRTLLVEPSPDRLEITSSSASFVVDPLPRDWPGPRGSLVTEPFGERSAVASEHRVAGGAWLDDLGGMGAGYAAALGGTLVSALGSEDDPMSAAIADLLERERIVHRPITILDRAADWTLLVTSGPHGDKLAIGFRGCHEAVRALPELPRTDQPDLVVVAGLPNRLAAEALGRHAGSVRMLAPAMRNMTDSDPPLASLSGLFDLLCCNRREWETLADREAVAAQLSVLAITDGPQGSLVRYRGIEGHAEFTIPAFPRDTPPKDTNRAGEAYASALVTTLLVGGWRPPAAVPSDLARRAAAHASATAALVLDQEQFGFPSAAQVQAALRAERVGTPG